MTNDCHSKRAGVTSAGASGRDGSRSAVLLLLLVGIGMRDERQCWRSRFHVKMLCWCTTQNDGSWSHFNVDEGKLCLPPLRD